MLTSNLCEQAACKSEARVLQLMGEAVLRLILRCEEHDCLEALPSLRRRKEPCADVIEGIPALFSCYSLLFAFWCGPCGVAPSMCWTRET